MTRATVSRLHDVATAGSVIGCFSGYHYGADSPLGVALGVTGLVFFIIAMVLLVVWGRMLAQELKEEDS